MFFYVNFSFTDPVLGNTLARIEATDMADAKRQVFARRGRDYGFIYTQAEFNEFPSKPWYDPETRIIEFKDVPASGSQPLPESRVSPPEAALA